MDRFTAAEVDRYAARWVMDDDLRFQQRAID
jgi:hypothetical protein